MDEPKNKARKVRADKGIHRRIKSFATFDYDEFMACYEEWRQGKITGNGMAKRLGTNPMTISNRLNYIVNNGGQVPSYWFTKNGRNLEDILREQKIAELMEQQKAEQQNGNE